MTNESAVSQYILTEPEHRARMIKFCETLESDEFEQGAGQLSFQNRGRKGFQHCCMGVACIVAHREGVNVDWIDRPGDTGLTRLYFVGQHAENSDPTTPPRDVAEFFGLPKRNPVLVLPGGQERHAFHLNDELKWPFKQIAAAFRYTYLGEPYPDAAREWNHW